MTQTIIEKPIINSPFVEPTRHFRFADEGITNEIVDSRRISSYFVPIASPKKGKGAGQQLAFGTYLLFLTRPRSARRDPCLGTWPSRLRCRPSGSRPLLAGNAR